MRAAYRYGPPMGRRKRWAMMHDYTCGHGGGAWYVPEHRLSREHELAFLEEYQRDVEELLADIADRVKELRKEIEEAETNPSEE